MSATSFIIILTLLFIKIVFNFVNAEKILFVCPAGIDSHRKSMYPLARALGQRGHAVTMFMPAVPELSKPPSASESEYITNKVIFIDTKPPENLKQMMALRIWKTRSTSPIGVLFPWRQFGGFTEDFITKHPNEFNELISQKWDLIVVDALFTPGGMLMALLTNSTYALLHPTTLTATDALPRGVPYPMSYVPSISIPTPHYDHKNFLSRLTSVWYDIQYLISGYLVDIFAVKWIFKKYHSEISLPKFYAESKVSFISFPQRFDYARPLTQNTIYYGGTCKEKSNVQLKEPDLIKMVDDPDSKGTIVIAFGHAVKWESAPEEAIKSFEEALNKLKDYRIIWQYDGKGLEALGSHIKTMQWLPQEALLNHPKTKLFVSHGGLKSISETICAEIPAVVIPFFAEQIRNAFLLQKVGAGRVLEKMNLTSENIYDSMNRVLNGQNFYTNVKKLREFFNDNPMHLMDQAVFWTEFHMRHKNVSENWFKQHNRHMNFFTYSSFDIIGLFIVQILAIFWLVKKFLMYK